MSQRSTLKVLAGATAIIAFGASVASAQQPRSTTRIPISKEGPARVDTVTVYKTDTVRTAGETVYHTDTLRLTNTVSRVDTVMSAPMMAPLRLPFGLYFGLAGGVSAPNGALFTPNSAGPSAQANLGWQHGIFGLRGDVNWAKPGEDSRFSNGQADPDILNWSADARINIPLFTHLMGATHRFGLYGVGGYTHTMYKNLPLRTDAGYVFGNGDWTHENGWNAGGGATLSWNHTELFFEVRDIAFTGDNQPQSRQIPFMLGINWYGSSR
jgi:hypothetical protein